MGMKYHQSFQFLLTRSQVYLIFQDHFRLTVKLNSPYVSIHKHYPAIDELISVSMLYLQKIL